MGQEETHALQHERIQKDRFAAVSPNCDQVFDQAVFARVAEL
jgi:hypothetical protein